MNMRPYLRVSLSPDLRYITWLAVVTAAVNYNVWFCTARLAFPFHSETANIYWIVCDIVSDLVTVVDIVIWQPRLQYVKGGDIIVSWRHWEATLKMSTSRRR